jgi:phage shock protein PspC (stress-responsive transcriptional regulator)
MTTPPNGTSTEEPQAPPPPPRGPRVTGEEMRDLARLRRSSYDRKIAGVAGGIARHFDIDPLLVRVALVVLVFFGGGGILLYVAGWLLIPEDDSDRATIPLDDRTRNVALWIAAGLAALSTIGDSVGQWHFPWPLVVVGIIVLVVLSKRQHHRWHGWAPAPGASDEEVRAAARQYAEDVSAHVHERVQAKLDRNQQRLQERLERQYPGYRPPMRDPRRRGPVLFGFTLALGALVVGILATAQLAGADITPSAYPAAVAATCGLMLVVSAWFGRGGGLILVGLVAMVATVAASTTGGWDVGQRTERPLSAAAVHDEYRMGLGEERIDLTGVRDLAALDGRTIHVVGRVGHLVVILPSRGLDVDATAEINGGGEVIGFGSRSDRTSSYTLDGGTDVPHLTIDAELTFGQIELRTEEAA